MGISKKLDEIESKFKSIIISVNHGCKLAKDEETIKLFLTEIRLSYITTAIEDCEDMFKLVDKNLKHKLFKKHGTQKFPSISSEEIQCMVNWSVDPEQFYLVQNIFTAKPLTQAVREKLNIHTEFDLETVLNTAKEKLLELMSEIDQISSGSKTFKLALIQTYIDGTKNFQEVVFSQTVPTPDNIVKVLQNENNLTYLSQFKFIQKISDTSNEEEFVKFMQKEVRYTSESFAVKLQKIDESLAKRILEIQNLYGGSRRDTSTRDAGFERKRERSWTIHSGNHCYSKKYGQYYAKNTKLRRI